MVCLWMDDPHHWGERIHDSAKCHYRFGVEFFGEGLMKDDPQEIADYLVRKNGVEEAHRIVFEGIEKSFDEGDFYAVSVWREVRNQLRKVSDAAA